METNDDLPAAIPGWIESTFKHTTGRDPLGLQSISTDRIMPLLVPGILALSRRARYFSFHCFLLDELDHRDRRATQEELSGFIKRREFELSLAVNLCTRCANTATRDVGSDKTRSLVRGGRDFFQRDESVESPLGGYGLYYRTPMKVLGLIAEKGDYAPSNEMSIPRDMLLHGTGQDLAARYRTAIVDTRYYREYFGGTQPIPRAVLEELSEHGCLCRLDEHPEEQALIERVLVGAAEIPETTPLDALAFRGYEEQTKQRRRSVALLLWILGGGTGNDRYAERLDTFFRRTVWAEDGKHVTEGSPLAETLAQWAALTARDYMQEGLAAIWSDICFQGIRLQSLDGMTRSELEVFLGETLVRDVTVRLDGSSEVDCDPAEPTQQFASKVLERSRNLDLEDLRATVVAEKRALSGLTLLLVLNDCLTPEIIRRSAWKQVAREGSNWQPGLLHFIELLREHLSTSPTVGETLAWTSKRFVINVHERNAFSKLPNYTFRFRWVGGRLQFYRAESERMTLPDTRLDAVSSLGMDIGLMAHTGETHALTERGWHFFREVFQ